MSAFAFSQNLHRSPHRLRWFVKTALGCVVAITFLAASRFTGTDCWAISINEIRTNQLGDQDDEYFELVGTPGMSLESLTYLVIGDSISGGSGVIEAEIRFDENHVIPDDGFFLATEITFGAPGTAFHGIIPDGLFSINFENRQNRTHLLVEGYFGMLNDDLDADDQDGLDVMPWGNVIDVVGIVEEPDTSLPGVDQLYAEALGGTNVGPTSTGVAPGHIYRFPDESGGWVIGNFSLDPNVDDTPGSMNGPADDRFTCEFVDQLVAEIVAGTNGGQFDMDNDGDVDGDDLTTWRTEAGAVLTASGNPIQLGDADLNGLVDGIDFIQWNANKFTATAAWCGGDFNADGVVDGLDFILWNNNKFTAADHLAVPEPSSTALWLGLLVSWGLARRRVAGRS